MDQVGVCHGCQRMVFHAAVAEQLVADKQMAFEYCALVVRKSGCGDGEIATHGLHQGFRHRTDVASDLTGVPTVESRAIFEIDLMHMLFF